MHKKIVLKVLIVLSIFLSSLVLYTRPANAALVYYFSDFDVRVPMNNKVAIPYPQLTGNTFDPSSSHWFYPSSDGGNTDLNLLLEAKDGYTIGEYTVYLQRAVNGSWVTVGHAGYPRNGSKTVNFTREYNNSYLYPTTPYRFIVQNNASSTLTLAYIRAY